MKSLAFLLLLPALSAAQIVRSLPAVGGLATPDGIAIDRDGSIFVADYHQGSGSRVLRVDRDGRTTTFADGFNAPDGLAFDTAGNLYVSNFGSGTIHRVARDGSRAVFASGLDHPAGLAFGADGTLYVAQFGNFNGTTVSRVSPQGEVSTLATGIPVALGVAVARDGAVFVSSFASGEIFRIVDGHATRFASVANAPLAQLQYLTFGRDGTLYVASLGHNRIYAIDTAGRVRPFAGTGVGGFADGDANTARFHTPNSIAITAGDTLVVTEYQSGRVRMIVPGNEGTPRSNLAPISVDARRLVDDSATFNVVQTSPAGRTDTLGTMSAVRRPRGATTVVIQRWSTGPLQSVDTMWLDRRSLRPLLRRAGPAARRSETSYNDGRIVHRVGADTVRVTDDGAFDGGSLDVIASVISPGSVQLFVGAQRGVVGAEVHVSGNEVTFGYPSALVRVRSSGGRVSLVEYDYGGDRRLVLSRR